MKKVKEFFNDFKAFISQGNIIDMAVGVVIGAAFKAIVSSLVADIINPCIALITGDVDLKGLKYVLVPEVVEKLDAEGNVLVEAAPEVAITYGVFLQSIIDFLLIAICIFIVLRIMMSTKKKLEELAKKPEEKVEEAPAEPTTKVCPFCKSEIAIDATRCAHCTSELAE